MSQKFALEGFRLSGKRRPSNVNIKTGEMWAMKSPDEVAAWLSDVSRARFNQFREERRDKTDTIKAPSVAEARKLYPWMKDAPEYVIHAQQKLEATDYFSSIKRSKSIYEQNGRHTAWSTQFKKYRESQIITALHNKGRGTEFVKLNRNKSMVLIKGNGWRLGVRFKHSPNMVVREYTSVRVDLIKRTVVFVNEPEPIERSRTGKQIGIDLGVVHTLTTSDGDHFDIPKVDPETNAEYKKLQRNLARQDRTSGKPAAYGSKRRQKNQSQIASMAGYQARRRSDWVEQVTTDFVRNYDQIVLEDLKPKNLTKRGKSKKGLNRSILESCWGMFIQRLEYKAKLAGVEVTRVRAAYTSLACNNCWYVSQGDESRKSQAVFKCSTCGHTDNADINAAKNILDDGAGRSPKAWRSNKTSQTHMSAASTFCETLTSELAVT